MNHTVITHYELPHSVTDSTIPFGGRSLGLNPGGAAKQEDD